MVEYDFALEERISVDAGYVAMMDATCTMTIQSVPGLKNKLLSGEGLFNTVITESGHVVLQAMPIFKIVGSIVNLYNNE